MNADEPSRVRLLTVCGSLQRRSANRAALQAAAGMAASAVVDDFHRLADIPAFDPDRAEEPIAAVDEWRRRVAEADVVLIGTPEYAGGLPGALKNALDWLVGSGELYRKPVAVLSAGTSGGQHARWMTAQTLSWQGAYVVAELGIAGPRAKIDAEGRVTDDGTRAALRDLVTVLLAAPAMQPDDRVACATAVVARLEIDTAHIPPA